MRYFQIPDSIPEALKKAKEITSSKERCLSRLIKTGKSGLPDSLLEHNGNYVTYHCRDYETPFVLLSGRDYPVDKDYAPLWPISALGGCWQSVFVPKIEELIFEHSELSRFEGDTFDDFMTSIGGAKNARPVLELENLYFGYFDIDYADYYDVFQCDEPSRAETIIWEFTLRPPLLDRFSFIANHCAVRLDRNKKNGDAKLVAIQSELNSLPRIILQDGNHLQMKFAPIAPEAYQELFEEAQVYLNYDYVYEELSKGMPYETLKEKELRLAPNKDVFIRRLRELYDNDLKYEQYEFMDVYFTHHGLRYAYDLAELEPGGIFHRLAKEHKEYKAWTATVKYLNERVKYYYQTSPHFEEVRHRLEKLGVTDIELGIHAGGDIIRFTQENHILSNVPTFVDLEPNPKLELNEIVDKVYETLHEVAQEAEDCANLERYTKAIYRRLDAES